ncbi:zinc-binding alcohol dehydrogenase family protein [Subtercola boreus]|nr:zinc-binding alcohol dehydrogenase family protein [Subtercola boreus]
MSESDAVTPALPTTMSAVAAFGGLPVDDPGSLQHVELPVPTPGLRDLLVEVRAVSVNPVDVKVRASLPASGEPRVLGFDAAGVVRAVGSEVTLFGVGDEVFYAGAVDRAGSNAAFQAVDERLVGRKPATLRFAEAAALPLTSITAWESLFDRFALVPAHAGGAPGGGAGGGAGGTDPGALTPRTGSGIDGSDGCLLVVGATGGVGLVILQLAEALLPGLTVIATAHGTDAERHVRELGAEGWVDHHGDLRAQVLTLAPHGVDYLFTSKSAGQIELYADIVKPFGHIVVIDDEHQDLFPLKSKSIAWHWESMFTVSQHLDDDSLTNPLAQHELLDRIADLVDEGRLRSTASDILSPLDAATLRRAHALVASGHTRGKVVVAALPLP